MAEGGYNSLVFGIIMLVLFGGIVPLMLIQFTTPQEDYDGYLAPVINFVQDGITFDIPIFGELSLNIFSFLGNFQDYLVTLLQGYSLIPAVLGIPIILITMASLLYGGVKLILP